MTHHMRQKNFTFGGNPLSHQIWATLEEILCLAKYGLLGGNPLSHQIWTTLEEILCLTKYGLLWRKYTLWSKSIRLGYFGGNF